jgi:hypothetical protein
MDANAGGSVGRLFDGRKERAPEAGVSAGSVRSIRSLQCTFEMVFLAVSCFVFMIFDTIA